MFSYRCYRFFFFFSVLFFLYCLPFIGELKIIKNSGSIFSSYIVAQEYAPRQKPRRRWCSQVTVYRLSVFLKACLFWLLSFPYFASCVLKIFFAISLVPANRRIRKRSEERSGINRCVVMPQIMLVDNVVTEFPPGQAIAQQTSVPSCFC